MTGPTQPAPRPLPNPGPPPAPASTTHPQPTRPTSPPPPPRPTVPVPASGHLPTLAQIIRDVEWKLGDAIKLLGRQWDPASGPSDQDDPWGPEAVDIHLGASVADIRSALIELEGITDMYSARQSTNSASLPGGPFNHPVRRPDEGLTPGLAAGAEMAASARSDGAPTPLAGSSHLAASSVAASGGLLPGLVDAAVSPTAGGTGESNTTRFGRDAGECSDPWEMNAAQLPVSCAGATPATGAGPNSDPGRRLSQRAPVGNGVTPGVGFTVPSAKPWMWSA